MYIPKREDGGAAFPMPTSETSQGGHWEQYGMSLRDWFAGQALAAIASQPWGVEEFSLAADWAYQYADEMLARRLPTKEKGVDLVSEV